jgi:hypothetical protein
VSALLDWAHPAIRWVDAGQLTGRVRESISGGRWTRKTSKELYTA